MTRRPYRHAGRSLHRPCTRSATRLLPGGRRPNDLALACRCLREVVRLHQKWAREDPELWGPGFVERDLQRLARAQQQREVDAALLKVYGPAPL